MSHGRSNWLRDDPPKKERPVGVPAARAWGWRERNLKPVDLRVECCAREQQYDRQEQCEPLQKPRPTPDYSYNSALKLGIGR